MIWSNEYWKLVITPKWVRIDKNTEQVKCHRCNGSGWIDNGDGWDLLPCRRCQDGKIERPTQIPPPPEMDAKFLDDLKNWINNYGE